MAWKRKGRHKKIKGEIFLESQSMTMTTLRIYDRGDNGIISVDLSDLIDVLAPRSLEARWRVSPVTLTDQRGRSIDEWMVVEFGQDINGFMEQLARKSFATGHVCPRQRIPRIR